MMSYAIGALWRRVRVRSGCIFVPCSSERGAVLGVWPKSVLPLWECVEAAEESALPFQGWFRRSGGRASRRT